jgi:undecaprenyl-diphosphatase
MHETVSSLVASYGYVVLFCFVGLESLGLPLPGETVLVTAASFAALGHLSIYGVIATAAGAAVAGDNGGYWIGRVGGLALVRRYGRLLHLDESHLARAHAFFDRHGPKAVFFGRFIALLGAWAAVLAGVGRMRYGTFMAYNALGGVCWSVLFGFLGYVFGRELPRLERYIGQASLAAALLVALVAGLALGWRWFARNRARLVARAQSFWQRVVAAPALQGLRARYPRAWTFVGGRFARGEYLGLHLTIGLLISLAGLWVFGEITEDVIHHDPLTRLDMTLLDWLHAHATPALEAAANTVTQLGSPVTLTLLALAVGLLLARERQWIVLGGWVAAFAGAGLLTTVLKLVIRRPRPPTAAEFHLYSWSFPSGHALGSLIGYGMLAYVLIVLWIRRPRAQVAVALGAALLIVAIGLSRLYLGVHYFSDVVGGYAAGVLWLSACISGVEVARRWPSVSHASAA